MMVFKQVENKNDSSGSGKSPKKLIQNVSWKDWVNYRFTAKEAKQYFSLGFYIRVFLVSLMGMFLTPLMFSLCLLVIFLHYDIKFFLIAQFGEDALKKWK